MCAYSQTIKRNRIMNREEIINSIIELSSDTAVKAWVFHIGAEYFHIASYSQFRRGDQSSIWISNKRGKRMSGDPIFHSSGKDHIKCINAFLDEKEKLEELERKDAE